ncbi:MAG: sugar transferase, partial [Actinomycetia bacterium]|nr:sugar transferase [Actinomycetes bacterium]
LIIGVGEDANRIRKTFNDDLYNDMEVVGIIDKKEIIDREKGNLGNYGTIGYLENIKDIIIQNKIHTLVISGRQYQYYEILDIIEVLKGMDVLILMFPGFFEFSINRMESREVSGIPLLHIANIGFFGHSLFIKNIFDYVLGLIFFIIFIPIYLVVGLIIKVDSRGPVFYKQKRATKDGKEFLMYKFRTMVVEADKLLEKLKDENETDGPLFKIKKDPRITRVGRFLRRLSIDEVPQIINVLRGELSLIGTRPPLLEEVSEYKKWHRKRLNVKQGITGLWQVAGRSELGFEEGIKLDLYYIQNWSIGMDIKILLKTIPAIISRRGAY